MKNLIKNHYNKILVLPLVSLIFLFVVFSFGIKSNKTIVPKNEALIRANTDVFTVINVITPKEGQQEEIVQLLQKGMTETMRYQPGFVSANIHKSLDSEHVVVYAQWKDAASLQQAVQLIEAGKAPNMLEVFSNATPDYHPYQVISVNLPSKKQ
ncbi:antibiotic biosynthesis monooxygenase family protein [Aquimarina sp. 2304DJ70-9]|uniref:antibiotic biosynthesis monooxygenase family protein n=1 Tax=Aquimarina penaris TaxID=3231044 RepID=UPI003462FB18